MSRIYHQHQVFLSQKETESFNFGHYLFIFQVLAQKMAKRCNITLSDWPLKSYSYGKKLWKDEANGALDPWSCCMVKTIGKE